MEILVFLAPDLSPFYTPQSFAPWQTKFQTFWTRNSKHDTSNFHAPLEDP